MSFRIRKIKGVAELLRFRALIGRQDLPMRYLHKSRCFGFFKNRNPIAGYCLSYRPIEQMSVIQQIPSHLRKNLINEDPFKYVEFTGYFLNTKKYAFWFKLHLVIRLLSHKASYVVYSYLAEHAKLDAFYRTGNPLRLYSGIPESSSSHLPVTVNVEILSKWGVMKIVFNQIKKEIRTRIKKVAERFGKQN